MLWVSHAPGNEGDYVGAALELCLNWCWCWCWCWCLSAWPSPSAWRAVPDLVAVAVAVAVAVTGPSPISCLRPAAAGTDAAAADTDAVG